MKLKKSISIPVMLFATAALLCAFALNGQEGQKYESLQTDQITDGCTVIIVGKDASTDGSVMSTHTCDCGLCDWTWRYVPAVDHKPGSMRKIYHINQFRTWPPKEGLKWEKYKDDFTDLEIPEVSHTYAYFNGSFGYMNDMQVAIGESTIGCRKKIQNPTPAAKFDITMLTLIAMERAKTAREAVKPLTGRKPIHRANTARQNPKGQEDASGDFST